MKDPVRCVKISLILYVTVFLFYGIGSVVYGLYTRLSLFLFEQILDYYPHGYFESVGLVVCGVVAQILVILGYFATLKESYRLQLTFAIGSCIYLAVIMGIGISVTASDGKLNKSKLIDHFSESKDNTMLWNGIHKKMHCCGIDGPSDWNITLPESCCYADPSYAANPDLECAKFPNVMFLYKKGCTEPLNRHYYKIMYLFHVIMVIKATLLLIGISLSFYMVSSIKKPGRGSPEQN